MWLNVWWWWWCLKLLRRDRPSEERWKIEAHCVRLYNFLLITSNRIKKNHLIALNVQRENHLRAKSRLTSLIMNTCLYTLSFLEWETDHKFSYCGARHKSYQKAINTIEHMCSIKRKTLNQKTHNNMEFSWIS